MYHYATLNSFCMMQKYMRTGGFGVFFSFWNRISFTLDRSPCLSNSLTGILLLHNELHQQPIHHLENNTGQKTITH